LPEVGSEWPLIKKVRKKPEKTSEFEDLGKKNTSKTPKFGDLGKEKINQIHRFFRTTPASR